MEVYFAELLTLIDKYRPVTVQNHGVRGRRVPAKRHC